MKFKLHRVRSLNKRQMDNKYIILVHIPNFFTRDIFYEPELKYKAKYFVYDKIKNYFYNRVNKKELPFHYYISQIGDDWEIFNGAPLDYRSWWLDNLFENDYIDTFYKNAIVIAVQDNYNYEIPDMRTYELVGQRIIEPFLFNNRKTFKDCVYWFDEIFKWDSYNNDLSKFDINLKYRYDVLPMKYFDRIQFNLEVMDYL